MERFKPSLFFILIFSEIIIVGILGFRILKKDNIKGVSVVIPLKKENFTVGNNKDLKYFYEPKHGWTEDYINKISVKKAKYLITSDTLNERYDYSIEKPVNVFRIITLGDSHTFGLFVDTVQNYPEQLEDKLNSEMKCKNISKFEVINLGVQGYDLEYAVERFKIRGQKYNPDFILWFIKNDDFLSINEIKKKNEKQYKEEMMQNDEGDRKIKEGEYNSIASRLVLDMDNSFMNIGETEILKMQQTFLERFSGLFIKNIVFFGFPTLQKNYKKMIEEYGKKHGKTYFATVRALSNKDDLIEGDKHPSAKGYALIVQDLFSFIKERQIVPCFQ